MASTLLWHTSYTLFARLVCPTGDLSFDVVVSLDDGSFWPRLFLDATRRQWHPGVTMVRLSYDGFVSG